MPSGRFAKDMSGEKYGRLTVIKRHPDKLGDLVVWECLCNCGNKHITSGKSLKNGSCKSCGCLRKETSKTNLHNTTCPIGYKREHQGYILIKTSEGFRREHTYLMEQKIGRKILFNEVVHHIDLNKHNNDIDNLLLMTNSEHTALHNTIKPKRRKYEHINRNSAFIA